MTDRPASPPPPERRRLVRYRGRLRRPKARLTHQLVASGLVDPRYVGRWPKARKPTTTTHHTHQGEPVNLIMIPDDDRPTTIEGWSIPQIPKDLSREEADALWAEIAASDIPDRAKGKLLQQINDRLEDAAGKGRQQPQSVSAGVIFCGASPDEVQHGLKALAARR